MAAAKVRLGPGGDCGKGVAGRLRPLSAATWAARAAAANSRWPAVSPLAGLRGAGSGCEECDLGARGLQGWSAPDLGASAQAWVLRGACVTLGQPWVVVRALSGRGAALPSKFLGLAFVSPLAWDAGQAAGFLQLGPLASYPPRRCILFFHDLRSTSFILS